MQKVIWPLFGLFCLVVIGIGVVLAEAKSSVDVPLEVAKGLISLAVAILITGALSYVLSERTRRQTEEGETERLLVGALQDLKEAHERVQVVQFRLNADHSPMNLTEQIEVLIEVRATLQRLRHERLIRDDPNVFGQVKRMTDFIRAVGEEYARNLPVVSRLSISFNRDMQLYLAGKAASPPSVPTLNTDQFTTPNALLD